MTLRIAALRLLSPDPELTGAFYESAFGATVESDGHLRIGPQTIELVQTAAKLGRTAPSNSTAFQQIAIVVRDMDAAFAHLHTVPGWKAISSAGPERLPASPGGARAFRFRDPDSHPLELLEVARNGIPSVWQDQPGLFLGVDHTTITITDTKASVAFYESLGLTVTERRVHQGAAQARLDGVADSEAEVTRLTPPGGTPPHVELVCYRQPGIRREPCGSEDVLATRIVFADGTATRGERTDPDGHRLVLV